MSSQVAGTTRKDSGALAAPGLSLMSVDRGAHAERFWEDFARNMRELSRGGLGREVRQGKRVRILWAHWTESRTEWNRRWETAIRFAALLSDSRPARRLYLLLQSLLACFVVDRLIGGGPKAPGAYPEAPQAEGTGPAGIIRFAALPCTPHAP
jgi:hypothetical protein